MTSRVPLRRHAPASECNRTWRAGTRSPRRIGEVFVGLPGRRPSEAVFRNSNANAKPIAPAAASTFEANRIRRHADGIGVATCIRMLKLLGSYVIAKLLGFGLLGALVIYALISMLT